MDVAKLAETSIYKVICSSRFTLIVHSQKMLAPDCNTMPNQDIRTLGPIDCLEDSFHVLLLSP